MLAKFVRGAGAAVLLLCASAAPAAGQTANRLGWLSALAGSCYQGRDAAGAVVDRQCFRDQYGHFLRASITRSANFRGESVMGYSRDRHRLEIYAWTNDGSTAILTPTYENEQLVFSAADTDGVPTRSVWRRAGDGFQVAEQRRQGDAWTDASVVTFRRDGAAPTPYSARRGAIDDGSGFEWLDRIAGRCFIQAEPSRDPNNRGCFAFQYPRVLRQTWYAGGAGSTGEAVMVRSADGGIRFFHWNSQGGFGVGESAFDGRFLVSMTDTADRERSVLFRSSRGFTIENQRRQNGRWEYATHFRYSEQ
ncbi:MAG TPA: hypothetical protein VEA80_16475 [Vitreimonas sp.]|uniref:hypothetical protein n=1 Tax=Vitreimonas sp. TaxID=3069702 RepID=UPI002D425CA6|nr:hypothetical protein [Vitreimonas sp.]HYD89074.1 hypothetical protein [Vitreimonas sp.]